MIDQKLFAAAAGRRFRIQAKSRANNIIEVLANNLSEQQCCDWKPSRMHKQVYTYFKVAYANSKLPAKPVS